MNGKRTEKRIKTISPGGMERTPAGRRCFLFLTAAALILSLVMPAYSAVKMLDDGKVQFSYYDPYAGKVSLAGSFNNWNTTATPMEKDEEGYWRVSLDLSPGEYEYKFVVDGAWITDQENPNTKSDPYGGMNSVVEIGSDGEILISGDTKTMRANTALTPHIHYSGRFLTRAEVIRGLQDDDRWRLQRPASKIDMNFNVMISDIVKGYSRLRIDTEKNFLEPNNISAILDQSHIEITPDPITLTGYYSEEILQSSDPWNYFGDSDLPGTIFDDHLEVGRGTAGITGNFSRYGFGVEGFFANVHDFDIYNDPDLFDNTGTDLYYGRVSREFGIFTAAGNFFMRRNMWWLDFTEKIGTDPVNTGIPPLDRHIERTGDPSDWFELDDKTYHYGLDLWADLYDGKLVPRVELLAGALSQRFVTANSFGINLGNAPINVSVMDQDSRVLHGGLTSTLIENMRINAEHTRMENTGADVGETMLSPQFREQDEANKQIYYTLESNPAAVTHDYTDIFMEYNIESGAFEGLGLKLWLQRNMYDHDSPGAERDLWHYNWSVSSGLSWKLASDFDIDIEQNYLNRQGSDLLLREGSEFEVILRGNYRFNAKLAAFADVRTIRMDYENEEGRNESDTFTAPFAGFRYTPAARVSVVLAYGLDPLDFTIDYDGRRIGRYLYRNEYLYENPGSTEMDAEEALANLQAITLRAVFNF